jgi:hypothetical protein
MFLKRITLALLVLNLGYAAYSQGWLNALTGADSAQREPERMNRQINASSIEVQQTPPATATAAAGTAAATDQTLVKADPATLCPSAATAVEQWVIYMGPYASKELLLKKKTALAKLNVDNDEIAKASLPRGLSLGRFSSEAEARSALVAMQRKGVKTATILLWSSATKSANC